jgi:hypothetical protein
MAELAAETADPRVALARAEAERDAAMAVAEARVAAVRDVVTVLEAQLSWHRKPFWRRWFG